MLKLGDSVSFDFGCDVFVGPFIFCFWQLLIFQLTKNKIKRRRRRYKRDNDKEWIVDHERGERELIPVNTFSPFLLLLFFFTKMLQTEIEVRVFKYVQMCLKQFHICGLHIYRMRPACIRRFRTRLYLDLCIRLCSQYCFFFMDTAIF